METISGKELLQQIYTDSKTDFNNISIDSKAEIIQQPLNKIYYLHFNNCVFKNSIIFKQIFDEELEITFENCKFESTLEFNNCNLLSLNIISLKQINNIKISNSTFDNIKINSYEEELIGKIIIRAITIKNKLDFSNLLIPEGQLTLNFKNNSETRVHHSYSLFENSVFKFVNFNVCNFGKDSNFTNLKIKETGFFSDCEFKKVSFEGTDFGNNTLFDNCKFYSYSGFEECKNLKNTNLKISSCLFTSFPHFNSSEFNNLEISHSTFERKTSFDSLTVKSIKLNQVTFLQGAYFDDIKIEKIDTCNRKTIRIIKQELINTHNQIDYLRFKAYELNAYNKEVNQNKLNWKDSLILYFNKDSNYFGLDWTKGLQFIIKWGFLFYFLYLLVYILQAKNKCLIPKQEDFYINYLKFLNPFSFLKSPIDDAENYFLPFLFFVLGKIFVSYGIYQTAQAFRKFGVNGG